jgi:hypothetical protein
MFSFGAMFRRMRASRPKRINASASFKGEGQFTAPSKWQHTREYYDKHPVPLTLVIAITLGSPFLGLVLAGWAGVIIGLVVSVISLLLGFFAVTKVREIREGL